MIASALQGPPQPAPAAPDVVSLLARAAGHPSGVTFVDLRERETHLTWGEVHGRARAVAAGLRAVGVRPGERVALVLRTEPAFLDAFFGAMAAGAVPVPLYPPVRLGRMDEYVAATARMVSVAGARLVLADGAVRRLLGEVVARARPALGCRTVESLTSSGARHASPFETPAARAPRGERSVASTALRDGRSAASSPPAEPLVDPDAVALVQFSSGSTVDPKPVALTHRALVAQLAALIELFRPTPADRLVSWLPLYHDMGLIGCLLGAVSYPGPLVLIPPEHFLARPALWLRALARHGGTISAAPSFAYAYAARRVADRDLAGLDLSRWRVALNGAEPVSAEVLRRFAARFAPWGLDPRALAPVYGLSEAALAVTFTPLGAGWRSRPLDPAALAARGEVAPGRREVVSVGVPVPGVAVEVRDREGRVVPERRLGRILVRGASVMAGYLGQPGATARALAGGWLDTGDLGFVDGGELYVHGRAKDVLVVRGANHAPDEIEGALEGLPGLRPGCAVAVGLDGEQGEEVLILAERGDAAADDGEVVARARRAVLERVGLEPGAVVLLAPGTLPRTSSGKMRRREALRRYVAGELRPPRPVNAARMAAAVLRSTVGYARARLPTSE